MTPDSLDERARRARAAAVQAAGRPDSPGLTSDGRRATLTTAPGIHTEGLDIPTLLAEHGLDPAEWVVERCIVNRWQGVAAGTESVITYRQFKLFLTRRLTPCLPARPAGPVLVPAATPVAGEVELIAVLPDQQVKGPGEGYDAALHDLVLAWLHRNRPHRLVLSGDLIDLPTVSRHPPGPTELDRQVQRGIDAAYALLRDYKQAAGDHCHSATLIEGNHEARLGKYLIKEAPQVYGVTRAGGGPPVLALPYLLRLDELGYAYVGEYPHGQVRLGKSLGVRHGWLAKSGAGATALATLKHAGHSIVVGHTHRAATVYHTVHEIDGSLRTFCAVEAGTLAQIRGGLHYAVNPDWTNAFPVIRLYPDGSFHAGLASYANSVLRWEGQRYWRRRGGVVVEGE